MAPIVGMRNGRVTVFLDNASTLRDLKPIEDEVLVGSDWRHTLIPKGCAILNAAGIERHASLILVMDNDATSVACLLGAMKLQCICVLVGHARVGLLPLIQKHTGIATIITVQHATRDARRTVRPIEDAANCAWLQDPELKRDGCVGLLTSGSIGEPKVVAHRWDGMCLQGECTQANVFPTQPARIVCATPISHMYSINAVFTLLTSPFCAQSELCFASTPSALHRLLGHKSDKLTILYGTPATYASLLTYPATPLYVDVAYCAGSQLAADISTDIKKLCGLSIFQNYGSTETGDITAGGLYESTQTNDNQPGLNVGHVWPGVQVEIDEDGTGEVLIRTPWQLLGYVTRRTLQRNNGASHRSGDRGRVWTDANGITEVALEGRLREPLVVDAGEHHMVLAPLKVEQTFLEHPQITDALALMQDETEDLLALRVRVVVQDPKAVDAHAIEAWGAAKLGLPTNCIHVDVLEYLPCSPAGKFMYR